MKHNNHRVRVGSKVKYFGVIYKVAALKEELKGFIIEYPGGWLGDEPGLDPKKRYYYIDFSDPYYKVVGAVPEIEV